MPELPEVERFRRLLLPLISTSPLVLELIKENPPKRFLTPDDIVELSGKCFVEDVLRKGKLITMVLCCPKNTVIRNHSKLFLFVHMGMTGRISTPDHVPELESLPTSEYPPPFTYLRFSTDTAEACFSDPRKFGSITLGTSIDEGFAALAPDALDVDTPDDLVGQSTGIKAMLLNQKRIMSGVGNWVADEVLYQCELHPEQSYLTDVQARLLLQTLKTILMTSIDLYEKDEDLPSHWLFHVRWGKRASTNGATIKDFKGRKVTFLTAAGRTSAIVPAIQKQLKSHKPTRSASTKKRRILDTEAIDEPTTTEIEQDESKGEVGKPVPFVEPTPRESKSAKKCKVPILEATQRKSKRLKKATTADN